MPETKYFKLLIGGVKIFNNGFGKIRVDNIGHGNIVLIGKGAILKNTIIRIRGNSNTIVIGDKVKVGPNCSFWMEGNNVNIGIGKKTTFTRLVHFCAQEDNSTIFVGEDCMFSNNIIVRTSDSHVIIDLNSNKRINCPKSVFIGNHVWVAPGTKIMKGSHVGNGCILGSNTLVTRTISDNCLAVGMPAKIVKENIGWTREILF